MMTATDASESSSSRAASLEAELRNKLKRSKSAAAEASQDDDEQPGPTKIRKRMLKVKTREKRADLDESDTSERRERSQRSGSRAASDSSSEPAVESAAPGVPCPPAKQVSPSTPKRWPRSHLAPPRSSHPPLTPCRSVYNYTRLNHIEEGTYGIVFRAKCNATGNIYALKKLKLEEERQGFPITSLREVMALMVAGGHENVVGVREIVVGDTLNQ